MEIKKMYEPKMRFFFLGLLLSMTGITFAMNNSDFDTCCASLKLSELFAKRLVVQCGQFGRVRADSVDSAKICTSDLDVPGSGCFFSVDTDTVCANELRASTFVDANNINGNFLNIWKNACVGSLDAQSVCTNRIDSSSVNATTVCTQDLNVQNDLCANNVTAQNACLVNLVVEKLCATGAVTFANFLQCGKYRATMTFAASQTYTLGDDINWTTVLDDPNGNVSFVPNTHYTAPVSGDYIMSVQLDQNNLQGVSPILGTPVANLEVLVNGIIFRQSFIPFLTFHNGQKATISALIGLKAGDVVTSKFNVQFLQDGTGFSNYVGTVDILGTGSEEDGSLFKIHLLSLDCVALPCAPCPSIGPSGTTGCNPCSQLCVPCTSVEVPLCTPCLPNFCSFTDCPAPCPTT